MKTETLKHIYNRIPSVECLQCGGCCKLFNPTFGISEIVTFFKGLLNHYPKEEIRALVQKQMFSQGCRFLGDDNLCSVWPYRPFACRIFGLEVLYKNEIISDYRDRCCSRENQQITGPSLSLKSFNLLNKQIDTLNQKYYPLCAPFWIRGLTFESWISLYMTENIQNKHLKKMQTVLRKNMDLEFLRESYQDRIQFVEKLQKLTEAQKLFSEQQYETALLEFTIVRNDNPDDYAVEESLFSCGICLEETGNIPEAQNVYQSVLIKTVYRNASFASRIKERMRCLKKHSG
ncbi:MAG: YkgJ family cysteine cluster protein [Candidatus Omnitrophica bacterium]|nr:YkgJ family cysteine cluster protein [Candidatus Omnitrophota bacterium]